MPRPEYANSTKLVRPMMTAPAFFNRSTTLESRVAGGVPTSTFDPPSVVTPASSNRSLIEIGMPASADSFTPPRRWASARSAAASASLSCTLRKVRAPSPWGSLIAASACSTSRRLVIFWLARSCESSTMVIVASSCPGPPCARTGSMRQSAALATAKPPRRAEPCKKSRRSWSISVPPRFIHAGAHGAWKLIRSPCRRAAGIDVDHSTPNHLHIHVSERDYDINPRFSAFIGFVVHGYPHNDFRIFCARLRPFALNNFRLFDLSKHPLHEYPSWQAATPPRRRAA